MATISLRAYNKEIDAMIDNGEVKEAIAHCRQILRLYPKHIETYRLLGKAYLETQRFTEAADVLQRVLSSLPDDFISQIGMSMIREDEGNLDAAIYHMERAFEAQPSNTAVQDELKRLYGRRDGVIPAKIRLTRGALVRMYARGDLYQQAIAEARVGLAEQPDRVDLEVILARMYFLSGQKALATEASSRLVEKLPYCFEANKILAEVLPNTSRAEDADIYKQRIFALDPYLAYLPVGSESSADVPEESVMVEKFEGELEEEPGTQPDWAQVAGVQLEQINEEENLPDWLTSVETQEQQPEVTPAEEGAIEKDWGKIEIETKPEDIAPDEETKKPEEELPDWMQAAGWQTASGDATEEAPDEEQIDEIVEELTANEAEIPEWLQEIAPGEETESFAGKKEEPADGEDNAWLDSIFANAEQKADAIPDLDLTSPEKAPDLTGSIESGVDLPDLAGEEFAAKAEEAESPSADAMEIPDWLTDMRSAEEPAEAGEGQPDLAGEEVAAKAEETEPPSADAMEIPDWLTDMRSAEEPAEAGVGLPDLAGEEVVAKADEAESPSADAMEIPDWLTDMRSTEEPAEAGVGLPDLAGEEAIAKAEEAETPSSDVTEIPDWLTELDMAEESAEAGVESPDLAGEEAETPSSDATEIPDWLTELDKAEESAEAGVESPDLASEEDFAKAIEADFSSSGVAEIPEWLTDLASEEEPGEEPITSPSSVTDDDDWLEILQPKDERAAKEGPDLGDFFANAEKETPPEADATQPTRVHTPEFDAAPFAPVFKDFDVETKADEEVEPFSVESAFTERPEEANEEEVSALPGEDDFLEFGLTEHQGEPVAEDISTGLEEAEEMAVPDWLMKSLDTKTGESKFSTGETALEETVTADAESAGQIEEEIAATGSLDETVDDDAAFAWLEALAARQGADEDSLQVAAEDRIEETPDWVKSEIEKHEFESEVPAGELEVSLEPESADNLTPATTMDMSDIEGAGEEIIFNPTLEETTVEEEEVEPAALSAEEPAPALETTEPVAAEPDHEELPEWLKETLETEQEAPQEEVEQTPEPRIFRRVSEWVTGEAEEPPAEIEPQAEIQSLSEEPTGIEAPAEILAEQLKTPPPAEPAAQEEEGEVEAVPEWLQGLTIEPPKKVTGMLVNAETPPEWLKELESEGIEQTPEELPDIVAEPTAWVAEEEEISKGGIVDDTSPLRPGPSPVATSASSSSDLYNAQAALNRQDIEGALEHYNTLISRGEALEDTIHDLRDALYRYPIDISIWQALGDAYARSNQLQEALDAYTKAEELLR